jgi:hypothetical protein
VIPLLVELLVVAALFATAAIAGASRPGAGWPRFVYVGAAVLSATGFVASLAFLLAGARPTEVVLPLGLPWIGAHLRLDALSA